MDSGKQPGKGTRKSTGTNQNDLVALQQQMALAAMGILPGMVDPSTLNPAASSNSDTDLQRLMALQAAGMPLMDAGTAAALAFGGVGGLNPLSAGMSSMMMPGASGGNDWLSMAQQAQLLAGLGGGFPPQMMSQLYGTNPLLNSAIGQSMGASSSNKTPANKVEAEQTFGSASKPAPTPSPASLIQKSISRPNSNASSSRLTPSGILSPGPAATGRPSSKSRPSPSTPHTSTKDNKFTATPENQHKKQSNSDQLIQAEMLRQVEQQFLLQQLQLKQHQEQIEAALTAINQPSNRQQVASNSRQQNTLQSEKLQQRLSESIYQQLLSTNPFMPGVTPSMNSYFGSQQMIEQMLAMGQQSSSSNFSKNKSASSQVKVSAASTILPPALSRETTKKTQNTLSSQDQSKPASLNKTFPANLLGGSSSFPLTGDPNMDMYLAAIYSQLQNQAITDGAQSNKTTSSRNSSEKPSFSNTSKEQMTKPLSKPKDFSVASDTTTHRRKQTNPSSLNAAFDTTTKASENAFSSRMTSPTNDVTEQLNREVNTNSQDIPLSLVRPKEDIKTNSESTKSMKINSNDFGDAARNSHSVAKEKPTKAKETSEKTTLNAANLGEKELLLTLQALAGMTGKNDSNAALEEFNKLLLLGNPNSLGGGENADLNKINELLNATVAAEMKRLQTQQATLTREIESRSKHDTRNSSPTIRNQTPTPSRSGTDSIDHKVPRKRRRVISDEDEVMEPLRQGWDREVKFRRVGSQIRGEVFYHTPEGRKLRTYPEVLKYLEDHGIFTLQRNNFSFSSKLKIGTFYEQKGESKVWTKIPDAELDRHLGIEEYTDDSAHSASASDDNQAPYVSRRKRTAKTIARSNSVQQAIEEKLRKEEESEAAKLAELKLREQRKAEAQLQREIKERQLQEERRKMEAARQLAKYQEAIRKEKEKEERRRQMMFIKTLETQRRAEERDRRREEMKNERIYIREKKMEQRRRAMKLARELKMPVEDMCLTNHQPMPGMQCLQGTIAAEKEKSGSPQLSGAATADVLMVMEFLYTFKSAIFLDDSVIPTFEQLQRGLLNDPEHVGALVRLTMALLHQCLCDPGVPAAGPWLHCLIGVKVIDLDVSKENYSEILRLFLWGRNGQKNEITDLLETEPFPALNPDQKAGVLASMVNELVCSKPVCDEIDNHLENLATLRRDKWIVEGKIRQARIEHANDGSDLSMSSPVKSRSRVKISGEDDHEEKADKEDSSKDDDSVTSDNKPTCRSDTLIERKMKRLTKEHQSFNDRLFSGAKPLRAFELGQDRYRRRYWVLSNIGGIYVEGLESGGWYDNEDFDDQKSEGKASEKDVEEKTSEPPCPKAEDQDTKPEDSNNFSTGASQGPANAVLDSVKLEQDAQSPAKATPRTDKESEEVKNCVLEDKSLSIVTTSVDSFTSTTVSSIVPPGASQSSPSCFSSIFSTPNASSCVSSQGTLPKIAPCSPPRLANTNPKSSPIASVDTKSSLEEHVNAKSIPIVNVDTKSPPFSNVEPKLNESAKVNFSSPYATTLPQSSSTSTINDIDDQTSPVINQTKLCSSATSETSISPPATMATTSVQDKPPSSVSNSAANSLPKAFTHAAISNDGTDEKICLGESISLQPTENTQKESIPAVKPNSPVTNSSSTSKLPVDSENEEKVLSKIDQDHVEAAARAIAAKAVASTSHLLFPQMRQPKMDTPSILISSSNENVPSTQLSIVGATPKSTISNSQAQALPVTMNVSSNVVPGLGKHMSEALECLGVNSQNLSQDQVKALSLMKSNDQAISINKSSEFLTDSSIPLSNKNEPVSNKIEPVSNKIEVLQTTLKQINSDQDVPMDLSKPSSAIPSYTSGVCLPVVSPNSSTAIPLYPAVKCESPSFDFAYYGQGSSPYGGFHPMMQYHPSVKSEMSRMGCDTPDLIDAKSNNVSKDPAPIPEEMKSGWWRITSEEEFDEFCNSLHCRGMREKHLQRAAAKNRKYCLEAIEQANGPEFQFANTSNKDSPEEEKDENIDDNSSDQTETFFDEDQIEDCNETALLIDIELIRQIDELVQKCKLAGVLHENTEKNLQSSERPLNMTHIPYHPDVTEGQRHDWLNPIPHDQDSALGVASTLVKNLERSLMRPYLKPPLVRKGGSSEFNNLSSFSDAGSQDVAAGLKTWRNAIATATSAAQLSICVNMLNSCINWNKAPKFLSKPDSSPRGKRKKGEKSGRGKSPGSSSGKKKKKPTKATAESGVESEDSASRTPLENMEEISRESTSSTLKSTDHPDPSNSVEEYSALQSDEEGLMIQDEDTRADADTWESERDTSGNHVNEESQENLEDGVVEKKKKKRRRKKTLLGACKEILRVLQGHEMATWFLFPVDLKAVPNYKKIIKKPMDFKTIEGRLRRKKYKFATEFADDIRTVFDNCQIFNEDDSPIGRAGHTLRSLFDGKWEQLQDTMNVDEPIG